MRTRMVDRQKTNGLVHHIFLGQTHMRTRKVDIHKGESLQHSAYEISYSSKGFPPKAYEISNFWYGFSNISNESFTPRTDRKVFTVSMSTPFSGQLNGQISVFVWADSSSTAYSLNVGDLDIKTWTWVIIDNVVEYVTLCIHNFCHWVVS